MRVLIHPSRFVKVSFFVVLAIAIIASIWLPYTEFYWEWHMEGKAKIREGGVHPEAISLSPNQPASVAPAAPDRKSVV